VRPSQLAALVALVDEGKVSGTAAKEVLEAMFQTGAEPAGIVEERGLATIEDEGAVKEAVERVLASNEKIVAEIRSGKAAAVNALVGLVMRETRGRASAPRVRELIESSLKELTR